MSQAGKYDIIAVILPVQSLTGDAGGAVSPTVGNIDLLGDNNITTTGNPGTSTITVDLTGTTQYAIQVGDATGSLDSLAIGSVTQILQSGGAGAIPAWSTATYPATSAQGDVLYSSAANTIVGLAKDATATRYLANTGATNNPAWDQVNLANGVSGLLPIGSGGTGVANLLDHSLLVGSGANTMTELGVATNGQLVIGSTGADPVLAVPTNGTNISWTGGAGTLQADLTATIAVTLGGTGVVSPTDHAIIVGSGAAAMTELAVGATNQVLLGSTGADPIWGAVDLTTDVTGTLPVANGGSGFATTTAYAVLCGGTTATNPFQPIAGVGNATEVLTSNGAGALPTFQAAGGGGGGITWNESTGTTQALAVDNGYITNNASQVVCTLPDTAALGSVIRLCGKGAGGWRISQNAGEDIIWDEASSTTGGVGGYLASTDDYDAIEILCTVADTTWTILNSKGNIVIV